MVMKTDAVPRWISHLAPIPVSSLDVDSRRFQSVSRLFEVVDVKLNRSLVLEGQCQPAGRGQIGPSVRHALHGMAQEVTVEPKRLFQVVNADEDATPVRRDAVGTHVRPSDPRIHCRVTLWVYESAKSSGSKTEAWWELQEYPFH